MSRAAATSTSCRTGRRRRRYADVVYCVFDLLVHRGVDITQQPLLKRKAALVKLFKKPLPSIMYMSHFETGAAQLFKEAVIPLKLEGLVANARTASTVLASARATG